MNLRAFCAAQAEPGNKGNSAVRTDFRFQSSPDRNEAAELAGVMVEWTMRSGFRGKGDLANQMRRAMLWFSNHLAEAISRGSPTEMLHYIGTAR
ncbi:hypothetical protein CKO51_26805 [Rhodopirellula sp. SM50]|nr:hypothetical protein CKO51_26805 [Rhodopirellula sp. SM50]